MKGYIYDRPNDEITSNSEMTEAFAIYDFNSFDVGNDQISWTLWF